MPLVVESGAIVAGANSYITLAEQKAFIGSIVPPVKTDAEIERAIILAARHLDGYYRNRWLGRKVQPVTQAMEWPRYGVAVIGGGYISESYDIGYGNVFLPSDTIPQRLKDAQCELALRALSGELSADVTTGIKREKVDVLETEYFSATASKTSYPVVDQLLSDYITPIGSGYVVRG